MCYPRGLDIKTEKNEKRLEGLTYYYVIMECINCRTVSKNMSNSSDDNKTMATVAFQDETRCFKMNSEKQKRQ